MEKILDKQQSILDVIQKHPDGIQGCHVAEKLGMTVEEVQRNIKVIRRRVIQGYDIPYIFTGPHGYSMKESTENIMYESKMRIKRGIAIISNGVYVFSKCKKISPNTFQKMKLTYKPKLIQIAESI